MREPWDKEWDDVIEYNNDGNDFFYEWYSLRDTKLEKVFEEWLLESNDSAKVRIKVRPGAIFISVIKGE
jgi:hypothetical protein